VGEAQPVEITIADPSSADAVRCIRAYFGELDRRSDSGFDPEAGISAEPEELTPPRGALLLAYDGSAAVACGAVKHHAGEPSEIKRMWVAPEARGRGLARRMLAELERLAAESGA
jgi:GNAT superfamily N-acetyltransferase